jgi:hypothetical protein
MYNMNFSKMIPAIFLIWNYHIVPNHEGKDKTNPSRAYYISSFGNDKNEGTIRAAFKSIQRLNQLHFNKGDSILFEGGHDYNGSLHLNPVGRGDPLHPIIIRSYGKGYASIHSGNESAISIDHAEWVTVKKLKLFGSGRTKGNVRDGLTILNSQHIVVDSLEISGFQKSGLRIDFSSDISIKHVFSFNNGYAGISVGGTVVSKKTNRNVYIGYCRAENNPGDPTNLDNHSGNGIVVSSCTKLLIEYCTAKNNGWDMPRKGNGPVGIWAFEADSVIIQHCLSYRNKTSFGGADGGGFDFDGGVTNSIVQYCLSYENQGAGYCLFQYLYASPWHDNIFRFNISENDGSVSDAKAGLYVWNSTRDSNQFYNSLVYNNTIYNSKVAAISFSELSERKGFAFYNNIFIGRNSLVLGNKGRDIFLANDWWSMNNGLTGIPKFRNAGKATLTLAAGLKNFDHYAISLNSPLRKRGINLWNLYGINTGMSDFNGGIHPASGIGASF